jgi:hypothetical protein
MKTYLLILNSLTLHARMTSLMKKQYFPDKIGWKNPGSDGPGIAQKIFGHTDHDSRDLMRVQIVLYNVDC